MAEFLKLSLVNTNNDVIEGTPATERLREFVVEQVKFLRLLYDASDNTTYAPIGIIYQRKPGSEPPPEFKDDTPAPEPEPQPHVTRRIIMRKKDGE